MPKCALKSFKGRGTVLITIRLVPKLGTTIRGGFLTICAFPPWSAEVSLGSPKLFAIDLGEFLR